MKGHVKVLLKYYVINTSTESDEIWRIHSLLIIFWKMSILKLHRNLALSLFPFCCWKISRSWSWYFSEKSAYPSKIKIWELFCFHFVFDKFRDIHSFESRNNLLQKLPVWPKGPLSEVFCTVWSFSFLFSCDIFSEFSKHSWNR